MRMFVLRTLVCFINFLNGLDLRKLDLWDLALEVVAHWWRVYHWCASRGLVLQQYFTDRLLLLTLSLFVVLLLGFRSQPVEEDVAITMVPIDLKNRLVNIYQYAGDPLPHDFLLLLLKLSMLFLVTLGDFRSWGPMVCPMCLWILYVLVWDVPRRASLAVKFPSWGVLAHNGGPWLRNLLSEGLFVTDDVGAGRTGTELAVLSLAFDFHFELFLE